MLFKSRYAIALSLAVCASLLTGCSAQATPAAAPKSGVYCKIDGKAKNAEASTVAKDLCKISVNVRSVLSPERQKQFSTPAKLNKAIPKGSRFVVHQDTWSPDGLRGGTLLATFKSPNKKAKEYLVLMLHPKNSDWKMDTTYTTTD